MCIKKNPKCKSSKFYPHILFMLGSFKCSVTTQVVRIDKSKTGYAIRFYLTIFFMNKAIELKSTGGGLTMLCNWLFVNGQQLHIQKKIKCEVKKINYFFSPAESHSVECIYSRQNEK